MAKDKYEISLWDDIFVAANGNIPGHYEEEKIAIIGSDTMTSQCRAIEPKLVCNVNGKVTFTFKMYLRYHDDLTGEDYDNPFLKLLVNERKIKVKWINNWYDLVIKNIQESSSGKTIVYSCEDANINELAKSGFDLVFDDELSLNTSTGGNQGTVQELVERTIEGTDWQIGENETIQQFTEEPVYEVSVTRQIPIWNMSTSSTVQVPSGHKILIFYPQLADYINNSSTAPTQTFNPLYIAYDPEQKYNRYAKTEMLVQADCYQFGSNGKTECYCTISGSTLTFSSASEFGAVNINNISTQYRANRLVSAPLMQIEPVTGQSCYVYKATQNGTGEYAGKYSENDIIYKSVGSEFGDALYATNLIANGKSFLNLSGWEGPEAYPLALDIYPKTTEDIQTSKVYLRLGNFNQSPSGDRYYYNDAFRANSQYFKDGCKQGEVFRVRVKALNYDRALITQSNCSFRPRIRRWAIVNNIKQPDTEHTDTYFSGENTVHADAETGWVYFDLTCTKSFTGSDIYKDHIGLFITQLSGWRERYIEEIQFFKITYDSSGVIILPNQLDKTGVVNTTYTYFSIKNGEPFYLYKGTTDWNQSGIEQQYNNGCAKIRSINIKQSNRFNILQTIAETFECWIRFNVPHTENGSLIYTNGIPKKFITIKRDLGVERDIGFVYGIDLQSISRTIESNQIVTKTIVLENNNDAGKNGTCRISRSYQNYPQVDYIFNFDYYINHKLLDATELNLDLYSKTGNFDTTRAYYFHLHKWNTEYSQKAEQNANYKIALTKNEGYRTAYAAAKDAAAAEIENHKQQVIAIAGTKSYTSNTTKQFIADNIDTNSALKAHIEAIQSQTQLVTYYTNEVTALDSVINSYTTSINANNTRMEQLKGFIKQKTELFQKKYARFISEGSWIDQKYYDDNLYYLDANSVAYTSSRPKVSYNIQVMRVSSIEGFELKKFNLGDITYIEDTDFFGYIMITHGGHEVKTPYREKVVITEITYNFDEPNKDSFKVQNYRTQFEDLFQRIAAQTQSLQYSVGAYAKVSDIINSDSTLKGSLLKRSMEQNEDALDRSSLNNSVVTNEQGITVTNLLNSSNAVRITSGGLFITTNGGDTWNNAIHGDGIGTEYLTSGAIDTHRIQIYGDSGVDDSAIAFKWDKDGISAYDKFSNAVVNSNDVQYDKLKFARFNSEGIMIQEATGTITSTSRATYEKLKLGYLGNKNNIAQYGLRIKTRDSSTGVVSTAFEATESSLTVNGDITAQTLTLGAKASVPADKVQMGDGTTVKTTVSNLVSTANTLVSTISSIESRQTSRNLIRNSNTFADWYKYSTCQVKTWHDSSSSKAATYVYFPALAASDSVIYRATCSYNSSLLPENDPLLIPYASLREKTVTLSWYVKGSSTGQITGVDKNRIYFAFFIRNKGTAANARWVLFRATPKSGESITTAFQRFSVTVQLTDSLFESGSGTIDAIDSYLAVGIYDYSPYEIWVAQPQLEIGDSMTPWMPMDEDHRQVINSTRIEQTDEKIELTATRIEERIGNANLLRNSQTFKGWQYSNVIEPVTGSTGINYMRYNGSSSPEWYVVRSLSYSPYVNSEDDPLLIPYDYIRDKTITVSFYLHSPTNAAQIDGSSSNRVCPALYLYKKGEKAVVFNYYWLANLPNSSWTISTSAKRWTWTGKITDANFTGHSENPVSANNCHLLYVSFSIFFYTTFGNILISRPQIELGSEATTWSPTTYDTSLSVAETKILQNADAISLTATRITNQSKNFVRNSDTFDGWNYSTGTGGVYFSQTTTAAIYGCNIAWFPATTSLVSWRYLRCNTDRTHIPYSEVRNKWITVSCYIRATTALAQTGTDEVAINLELRRPDSAQRIRYKTAIFPSAEEMQTYASQNLNPRYQATFQLTDAFFANIDSNLPEGTDTNVHTSDWLYLTAWVNSTKEVRIIAPQIEISYEGAQATPWHKMEGESKSEAEFKITSDSISSVVSRTTVLEQKGGNLLRNAGTLAGWALNNTCTTGTAGGTAVGGNTFANFRALTSSESVTWRAINSLQLDQGIPYSQIRNRKVTISFYAASTQASSITGGDQNYLGPCLSLHAKGNTSRTKCRVFTTLHSNSASPLTTSWKRFSYTFDINDAWFTAGTGTISDTDVVYFQFYNYSPYQAYFCCPQIEVGSVATEWAPMIGDNSIAKAESQIVQQADQIALKVESSEYTADKVLQKVNASSLTISPDRISLAGKTISLTSDNITINSTNFSVDKNGTITAKSGEIGGWQITSNLLRKSVTSSGVTYTPFMQALKSPTISSGAFGVSATTDGTTYTYPFIIRMNGTGNMGPVNITSTGINVQSPSKSGSSSIDYGLAYMNRPADEDILYTTTAFGVQTRAWNTTTNSWDSWKYPFGVRYNGELYTSKINATGGTIAKWEISAGEIGKTYTETSGATSTQHRALLSSPASYNSGNVAFSVRYRTSTNSGQTYNSWTNNFYVTYGGKLFASNVEITGSGSIGGCTMSNGVLTVPGANVSGLLSAATIKANSIDVTSGKILASQIDGKDLVITGSGKIGPFQIGTDGYGNASLNTTNCKLSDYILQIGIVKTNRIEPIDSSKGWNDIAWKLSTGGTTSLKSIIEGVVRDYLSSHRKSIYQSDSGTNALYSATGTNRSFYAYAYSI